MTRESIVLEVDVREREEVPAIELGVLTGLAGFMLRLAQLQVFEAFYRDLTAEAATPGQIGILVAIQANPGIRQGVLADALRIKWSNMAKIIRLFERQELIERMVSATDRRTVELRIALGGRALLQRLLPKVMMSDAAALAPLNEREQATLLRLLAKLTHAAEAT
jgi:DNA-binding MarR family transcriptional regulator